MSGRHYVGWLIQPTAAGGRAWPGQLAVGYYENCRYELNTTYEARVRERFEPECAEWLRSGRLATAGG